MDQLRYLLPGIAIILVILFVYGRYQRRAQVSARSRSFIVWLTLLILITAITLGTAQTPIGKLGFILFAAVVTGLYYFFVRPHIYHK
jgi:chromate transport protein ChrA